MSQHDVPNLDIPLQNKNFIDTSLPIPNRESGAQHTKQSKEMEQIKYKLKITAMESAKEKNVVMRHTKHIFFCAICETFMKRSHMQEHWDRNHVAKDLTCGVCSKNFSTLLLLQGHMVTHLPLNLKNSFEQERTLEKNSQRRNRNNVNSDINPIQKPSVLQHLKCNEPKNDNVQIAKEQNKIHLFETGMELSYGTEIHDKNTSNSFLQNSLQNAVSVFEHEAPNFDETFQKRGIAYISSGMQKSESGSEHTEKAKDTPNLSLRENIQNGQILTCDTEGNFFCGTSKTFFGKKQLLQKHWGTMQREKGFECIICCKKFSFLSQLRRHKISHAEKFMCDKCEFKSSWKINLVRHMKVHSKETPFVCVKCRQPFKAQGSFVRHLRSCHSIS